MNNKDALIKLHTAVALFGMAGVIGKFVTWNAAAVTFGRVLFSSVFLLIFMTIKKEKMKLDCGKDYILIAATGIIMAAHWTCFIHSIQISSVAIGTITFATFPIFVTFLEPLIYKEKLKGTNIIVSLVMIAGVVITIPEFSFENSTALGVFWGMVSSFTYAALSLMNRYFSARYTGRQVCLYEQGTASIVLLPLFLTCSVTYTAAEVTAVVFMGVVCTAAAHSLFVSSLNKVKVQTAGIISGMETVYGIVFAMIFLQDMITVREFVGGIVILGASLYKTLKEK